MTPEKLNKLIPDIHAEQEKRKVWDDLPPELCIYGCQYRGKFEDCHCDAYDRHSGPRRTFLAGLLDLITESMVYAAHARREGRKGWGSYKPRVRYQQETWGRQLHEDLPFMERPYAIEILDTEEYHLARTLYLLLDLMGFYRFAFPCYSKWLSFTTERCARSFIGNVVELQTHIVEWDEPVTEVPFMHLLNILLTIAELENIDLEWHLDALRKYQEMK